MRPLYVFALGGLFGALALGVLWWEYGDRVRSSVQQSAPSRGPYTASDSSATPAPLPASGTPNVATLAPTASDDAYQLGTGKTVAEATTSEFADALAMGPPAPDEPQTLDPNATVMGPPAPTALDRKIDDLTGVAASTDENVAAVKPDESDQVTIPGTDLLIPVEGIAPNQLVDTFTQARAGGARVHDAIDIMAPAGTKVFAVADGRIEKLFLSKPGGLTVYQFDPDGKYAYYYAHLQSYAPNLTEGQLVKRGDLIGYVGSTGNADPKAPHLHFAIMQLGPEKRWWEGIAINPYPLFVPPDARVANETGGD